MSTIHPTAIVHPGAVLGESVRIGPGAVLEGPAEIGAGTEICARAILLGRVILGENNLVGHGAVLGGDPQALGFDRAIESGVRIGHRNIFREHCTVHRSATPGGFTEIGDDNYLMAVAHVGHDSVLGNKNVLANNVMVAGHVHIADGTFLGGGSMFHQFIRVGSFVITQGGSGFGKDLPPYTMAVGVNRLAGLNVVGLRRAGFGPDVRKEIQAAYRLLFRAGKNLTQALEEAAAGSWGPEAVAFFEFVRSAGKRGLCAHLRKGE